ncbi:serine/threonine-protein kinase [uncultured Tessaracoccus sp.]|uniref:serine/threonine-protein kinase n=1 Tax=uncultured Tessaracoccus sp. TaxID=905023 RepID=UPI0026198A1D|nr:serine/threonine-protein kinase [uncultured Tessaracoccus sp.]
MGQVIAGRFELLEHIASGATGSIWRAVDRRRNSECAAKVLRQKDSGELLRFVREQGIQLDHPHLATPYGWAAEDDDVAIAMPLVRGGTLESALSDHGAFSPELVATCLYQLLDGIAHVHDAGWIHRDVKPANILLEPTGTGRPHLRLGDFGTALRTDDPRFTAVGFIHGTPGYVPPEALDGAAPASSADLYAAGIVALRMLHPEAKSVDVLAEARQRITSQPLPPPLQRTVLGLTSENPEARIDAAQEARRSLAEVAHRAGYTVANGEPFEVFDQLAPDDPDPTPVQSPEPPSEPTVVLRPAPTKPASKGPLIVIGTGVVLLAVALVLLLVT